jgi:hypothetical protein
VLLDRPDHEVVIGVLAIAEVKAAEQLLGQEECEPSSSSLNGPARTGVLRTRAVLIERSRAPRPDAPKVH